MDEGKTADYLSENDEEINEDYEIPAPDEEFPIDLSATASNGLTFTGQDEFEKAIFNLKDIVHEEFFQNGSLEKVHNMGIINEYTKFLNLINEAIGYVFSMKTPINNMFAGEVGDKMKEALKLFFDIVLAQSQLPLNGPQTNYRNKLIKLQLTDYPFCHNPKCLSPD